MAKAGTAKAKSIYGVHPGVKMVQDWVAGLKEKTGRTLEDWVALVKKAAPKDEKQQREWLKKEHKLGTNSAWWITERADNDDEVKRWLKAAYEQDA